MNNNNEGNSPRTQEQIAKKELSTTDDSGPDSDTASPLFTKIKPLPLKTDQVFVKEKSPVGRLDNNSNIDKKKGSMRKINKNIDVKLSKSGDVKTFSTRPVCICPHRCSSARPSRGTCPLHPTTVGHLQDPSKSSSNSLKDWKDKLQSSSSSGNSSQSQPSSEPNPSYPGCTCPSFRAKSRGGKGVCQVHPKLHHLRQPAVAADCRRRRIDKTV